MTVLSNSDASGNDIIAIPQWERNFFVIPRHCGDPFIPFSHECATLGGRFIERLLVKPAPTNMFDL
ncbi:hypothetical protein [Microseira wollei]|uniref:hypothetical protein n=1 Tax=Microseira wollei TaxID=467598 RepID=UPI001CFF1120|nr:hypothetical protein [Microseira wollei]